MSVRLDIQRCSIYPEFSAQQQNEYFSIARSKVIHNIDTYYYNVHLKDDGMETSNEGILAFLVRMAELKRDCEEQKVRETPIREYTFKPFHYAIYEYRVSLENAFDIFVASYLPNDETPRITVQLRSVGLWLDGCTALIEKSFTAVLELLSEHGVQVRKCVENRIDYAFHTNIIQSTSKYFGDKNLKRSLKTALKIYQKVGRIGREISVDYLSLGNRKSNNIFFRAYNKNREVVEKNYKGFFIDYWYQNQLISAYDKWCLEYAYEKNSYNALLIARCEWYLGHGSDSVLKDKLQQLLTTCRDKSDNYEFLEKSISGVLPEVTQVMNIEYQTKRKFYHTMDNYIQGLPSSLGTGHPLHRLFSVVENRKPFLNYLTSDTVKFIDGDEYASWWKRIRSVKVKSMVDTELVREYARSIDKKRVKQRAVNAIATYSTYENNDNDQTFTEDVSDLLCGLNDNDLYGKLTVFDPKTAEVAPDIRLKDYDLMKKKKWRTLRSMLEK